MKEVAEHVITRTLREVVITPDHAERTESPEFRKAKQRLKEDGHTRCWVCGTDKDIQYHHHAVEWSLAAIADWDKVKTYCEEFDPLGYGRLMRNIPMTSPDDPRNLIPLCQRHHTGVDHENGGSGTGIHELTYPVFLIQKLAKDGVDAVPQAGETLEQEEETVKVGEA
ncbi:MAG: hypothetical protein K6T81_04210 [Alicyclobacillus macrosporangiidus]|uniref:hypothetical protein n=1 Tax=Alicyclobacillus macrosporangiidus TaxID=392015 RepID=UPI0026F21EF1|nr:hypothetical protein [Alicyclobacillus macrosporangiidus]MCL6597922.1 hypothetical protein [Alicyclobacillus macrosporangiidus]